MIDPLLPPETRGPLLELLHELFGSRARLVECRVTNHRLDYFVLLLRLRDPTVWLSVKLAGPAAAHVYPFERAAMLSRLVAERTSVPMPEVVALDVTYRRFPWRYIVKTYIPGEEWARVRPRLRDRELRHAYQQLGAAVAALHAIRFPAFGDLDDDGAVAAAPDFLAALAARADRIVPNPRLAARFLALLNERSGLFSPVADACLCHEDLHHYNVLFRHEPDGWRLATILDFDKAWAGHDEIDIARMQLWRDMLGDGFWPAYTATHSLSALYEQRRPIYQLLWCLEYAANTPEHLADTQRLCRELGITAVESFD